MSEAQPPPPRAFVDTNIIIRYLMQDQPSFADDVRRIIDESPELWITDGIIAEVAYVLMSVYRIQRERVVDHLVDLLNRDNIRVHGSDKVLAIAGLYLCRRSGRVSFPDALLWAVACSTGPESRIYTLDRRFPADGVELRSKL